MAPRPQPIPAPPIRHHANSPWRFHAGAFLPRQKSARQGVHLKAKRKQHQHLQRVHKHRVGRGVGFSLAHVVPGAGHMPHNNAPAIAPSRTRRTTCETVVGVIPIRWWQVVSSYVVHNAVHTTHLVDDVVAHFGQEIIRQWHQSAVMPSVLLTARRPRRFHTSAHRPSPPRSAREEEWPLPATRRRTILHLSIPGSRCGRLLGAPAPSRR